MCIHLAITATEKNYSIYEFLKSESVANPGEGPLSLGLDDRPPPPPPPPPLSEGLDLPLAINDNSDVLPLISSGLIHPRKGF